VDAKLVASATSCHTPDLLRWQAALILTRTLASSEITSHSRSRLWITIFLNKQGLQETLSTNSICTKEIFSEFCEGFSQASPMFTIVDVGGGKEAADTKIKGRFYVWHWIFITNYLLRIPSRVRCVSADQCRFLRR